MKESEVRREIAYRLERETRYVERLASSCCSPSIEGYLKEKIADNDKTIELLGKYLETQYGDTWETFYRENYWSKKS